MKKLISITMVACLSLAMAGAYADDMKKDGMMKQDGGAMMKDDMGKGAMKMSHKKAMMKKEDKGMGEMKKDDDKMGKEEMKK